LFTKMLFLTFLSVGVAYAQTDTLRVEPGTGVAGGTGSVEIGLDNADDVGALQFFLNYDADILTPTDLSFIGRASGDISDWMVLSPGALYVAVANSGSSAAIPAGTGSIVRVSFDVGDYVAVRTPLDLSDVMVSDPGAYPVDVGVAGGVLAITGSYVLEAGTGKGSPGTGGRIVPMNLANDGPVGGVQFTLRYDATRLEIESVEASGRSDGLSLFEWTELVPGELWVVQSGEGGETIGAGSGSIMDLSFRVAPGAAFGPAPLALSDVFLSDVYVLPLESVALGDGAFDVHANLPPVAVDDAYGVNEDGTLNVDAPGVLSNDSDSDGDALTAVWNSDPSDGALTLNADGSFTYTPNADFNGTDRFTYHANDGTDDGNVATVTITVNAANDPPVAMDDAYSVDEDGTLNVGAPGVLENDSDLEGDPLTAVLDSGPSDGMLTLNSDGSFTYTPNADFSGTDRFTYKAKDVDYSDAATVTISVNAVSDAPVAVGDGYSVDEDSTLNVAAPGVLGNDRDVDGDTLTAVLIGGVSNGTLTLNANGSFTYAPHAEFSGTDTFTYTVDDGKGNTDTAEVTVTVQMVNDSPVVSDIPDRTILEGEMFSAFSLDSYVSDADDSDAELTWSTSG
ncbi:MAG: tandem-95 repeat protein, partial [Candidatus Latescibacteria bacterium]|nr:tandem-95 repeat protein [Candidatus Latescibacterota bacterium]